MEGDYSTGNDTERIVNGEKPDLHSFLVWIEAFKFDGERKEGYGALISRRHILTVASLVQGYILIN